MSDVAPPAPPLPYATRRRQYHLRRWAVAMLGVLVVADAADYLAHRLHVIIPHAQRLSTIQAMPEASLLLPGSQVLYKHGSRPTSFFGLGTSSEAFTYNVAGTNETPAAVLTFYTANLEGRGWQGSEPGSRLSSFDATVAQTWQRGHYLLDVAILGPQSGTYPGENEHATTYVIEIQYTPSAPPTPTR